MAATHHAPCDAAAALSGARSGGARHPSGTLAASILGSSLAFIDGSVVNVALPAIGRDLGADAQAFAWIVNAYILPLSALILLGGALGDRAGRRRMFVAGIAVFLTASLACALAPGSAMLLAGRAMQGIGAAMLMPNSLAFLGAAFDGAARGRAIGTWAAAGAVAGALGPLVGGWLVDGVGWRSIFYLNLPVGAAAMLLAWRYVEESRDDAGTRRLDWAGAATATAALGCLTFALTAASDPASRGAALWGLAAAGIALAGVFAWIERRRGDHALMPLALFSTATFAGLSLLTLFLYAALGGLIVILPFLLIRVAGWSATAAGAAMLPIPLLIGLGSRAMGGIAARSGGRLPLTIGSAIVAGGMALFLRVGERPDYWTQILPAIVVVAVGMAISVAPLTTSVIGSVDRDHVGVASGFNSAVARIGGLFATALLGFVFASEGSAGDFVAAMHVAAIAAAALALLASVSAFLLIAPPRA